jgi:hypothetical protein
MTYVEPIAHQVRLSDGTIPTAHAVQERRLRDLRGLFADREAEAALWRTTRWSTGSTTPPTCRNRTATCSSRPP